MNFDIGRESKYKDLVRNSYVRYRVLQEIGKGSFGNVYAGKNEYGELLAIKSKRILSDRNIMAKSTELFESELESLYNLDHRNILKLLGVEFKKREVIGLIMEYIRGETLDKVIVKYGPLHETNIQSFMKQIIDAIAYMHSNLVMHRDLKSSNVMLISNQYIKIIDFGMAKHFDVNDTSVVDHGMVANTIVGTVPYMSPEIINFSTYNSRTDIWSAGVIMFEMAMRDMVIRNKRADGRTDTIYLAQYQGVIQCQNLSALGNDFLQMCLIKQLEHRPSAMALKSHQFILNVSNPMYPQAYANYAAYGNYAQGYYR